MKKILIKVCKVLLWSIFVIVLIICATLTCTVNILKPSRLTPIANRLANDYLDADVNIARAELSFSPHFPILSIDVDSLTIVSHAFEDIPDSIASTLPAYADSLLIIDKLRGGIDLGKMLRHGEFALCDVQISGFGANIVSDGLGHNNFDIYSAEADTIETSLELPAVSINSFKLIEPREIRYFNALDSMEISIAINDGANLEGQPVPQYNVLLNGNISSGILGNFIAENSLPLSFELSGDFYWNPQEPNIVSIDKISLHSGFIDAHIAIEVSIEDAPTINSCKFDVSPIAISDVLNTLPSDMLKEYGLNSSNFATDANVAMDIELQRPFNLATDSIPYATINISVPDAPLRYGKAKFKAVGLDLSAHLNGNNLDSTIVDLRRLIISGPATDLEASASVCEILSDPDFKANLKGHTNLRALPPILTEMANGNLDGQITVDMQAKGKLSMLDAKNFHKLDAQGKLNGVNINYQSNDSTIYAFFDRIGFRFGTNAPVHRDSATSTPSQMLAAGLSVDSTKIIFEGIDICATGLKMGVGVENSARTADTTSIVPLGGGISLSSLKFESAEDSLGLRLKDASGHISLQRFEGQNRTPEIVLDLTTHRMAAGSPIARFMLSKAQIHASTHLIPERAERRRRMFAVTDSLHRLYPELSQDSISKLAFEKQMSGRKRPHRQHKERIDTTAEILDWGLSKGFGRFLNDWAIEGSITTSRASLYTPLFPLRNRMRNLNMNFSNDSITFDGVKYTAGRSDMTLNGKITNLKRSLSGNAYSRASVLKAQFGISSDTIDVNQLAAATFAGAAYSERISRGENIGLNTSLDIDTDDDNLQNSLDSLGSTDQSGALLIPTNLDATLNVRAKNIIYSDLNLQNFSGNLLIYDGAVNLNNLNASSDAGNVNLSALYSAPKQSEMKFGFGLLLEGFKIERFLNMVPAIDSVMPLMRDFSGVIDANIAATVDIDSQMNFILPSLDAAIKLSGENLTFIDQDTYRTIGKWLMFRDKSDNHIDSMSVELLVRDNNMELFPFSFDIDRYRLGVFGTNDMAMNFNYHISVLKSPLPFKFGITVKGNPDKYKVRLGGAKYKDGMSVESVALVDTVRVNLINQIENVFRRGVSNSKFAVIDTTRMRRSRRVTDFNVDTLSRADSLILIREGYTIPTEESNNGEQPLPEPNDSIPTSSQVYIRRE